MLQHTLSMPLFRPCTAMVCREKAINIRRDTDGTKQVFQLVDGSWIDISDVRMLPSSLRTYQYPGTSTYWQFVGMVPAH